MLVNMKEILKEAEEKGYAIGCINTPNMETLRAVVDAAEELNVPIIIDHAQVHDPLIPMESIGPKMVEYAKQAKVPVCVIWIMAVITASSCVRSAVAFPASCMI